MVAVWPPLRATAIGPPTFLESQSPFPLETIPMRWSAEVRSPRAVPK